MTVERGCAQWDVLTAFQERLISQVPQLTADNTFICVRADPSVNVDKGLFATLTPVEGAFDQEVMDGAGAFDCREYAGVQVTVFNAQRLGRVSDETALVMQPTRGLLEMKRQILAAFTGHDLQLNGQPLLSDLMLPLSSQRPQHDGERLGDISLTFSTNFRWEL